MMPQVEPYSGWDNLRGILSRPDNVPILILIGLAVFFTALALRQAFRHDRLIREGRKQDVLRSMTE